MDKAEAEAKAKAIAEALGWEEKFYLISAASQQGVKDLCWDVMTFIIENPIVHAEEEKKPKKSSLCGTTITVSSLKKPKPKWKMTKTGMTTGTKTTKKASNSSTNANPDFKKGRI
jgi:GTPase involved in cell partitioning and DNA repair